MQIGTIDRLSLENLAPQKLQEARAVRVEASQAAPARETTGSENLGMDLEGLGEVHSLDPARVASLIADPFGDD